LGACRRGRENAGEQNAFGMRRPEAGMVSVQIVERLNHVVAELGLFRGLRHR